MTRVIGHGEGNQKPTASDDVPGTDGGSPLQGESPTTPTSGTPRRGRAKVRPTRLTALDIELPMRTVNPKGIKPELPMTQRQREFAELLFFGYTPWMAYQKAYGLPEYYGHSERVRLVKRILWSPAVRQRIAQLRREESLMSYEDNKARKAFVLQGLTDLASDETISPMARLKALELLGKVRGTDLFTDRVETVHQSMTDAQVREALTEKLQQLGVVPTPAEPLVIDVKPSEET